MVLRGLALSFLLVLAPQLPAWIQKDPGSKNLGRAEEGGRCPKPQWDERLQFVPSKNSYEENEELTLNCSGDLEPSYTKVKCAREFLGISSGEAVYGDAWWGTNSTGAWTYIERAVECIETCKRPSWDPRLQLAPDRKNYRKNEEVVLSCPKDFQPSFTRLKCLGEDQTITSWNPLYRDLWLGRDGRGDWIHIQSRVECIGDFQIVPGTLEISSTSITLNWTCRLPDACQYMRATCRLALPASPPCEAEEVQGEEMLQGQEGTFTCPPLQPFTVYSVTISLPPNTVLYTKLLTTKETVPDKPENLWLDPNTGCLKWEPLPPCKGKIIGYQLNITAERAHDGSFLEFKQVVVNQSVTQYMPPRQAPGSKYMVAVQGLTAAGAGAASILEFQTYVSGQPPGPWPGTVVTVVVVVVVLVALSAGILWFVLSRRRKALPSKVEEDHYTELQPYENVDNYCVVKGTLLAEEEAGKGGQAGEMLPQTPPVLESSRDSQSSEGEEKMRLKAPAQC
ncbi:PREDICTED: uncharacterized protein LOC106894030 [Calidris pugnax]|uniref:uncharacterized protein LOC106894030 n=1 Tax=Calidris pugnax TaxID=198806 RepID=UPI00071CFA0A|nr:PREDICTED: uncharacterized protein LOC106894030 [Calidris pugnax]